MASRTMDPGLRRDDIAIVDRFRQTCFAWRMGRVYIVYIMASMKNGTLYTGVTGNPAARMWQHKNDFFSNSFSARYAVKRLVWYEVHEDPRSAIQREKRIKEWKRDWKKRLVEEMNPTWRDLAGDIGL